MVRFSMFFFNPNVCFAMFAIHIEASEAGKEICSGLLFSVFCKKLLWKELPFFRGRSTLLR